MGKILLIHLASPGLGEKAYAAHKSINKKEVLFLNMWEEAWAYKKGEKLNLTDKITKVIQNNPIDKIILSAHGRATDVSSFFSEKISETGMPLSVDYLFNIKECIVFVRELLAEGNVNFPEELELNVCFGARTIDFNLNHLKNPINPMQSLAYSTFVEAIQLNPNKPFQLSAYIGIVQTEILRGKKQFAVSTEDYYEFMNTEYELLKDHNRILIKKVLNYFGEQNEANIEKIFNEKIFNQDKLFNAYCWGEEQVYNITDEACFSDPNFILSYTKKLCKQFNIEDKILAELIISYIVSTQWNIILQRKILDRDDAFFKTNYGKTHFAYNGQTCTITMLSEDQVATFYNGPLLIQKNDINSFEKKSFQDLISAPKCIIM